MKANKRKKYKSVGQRKKHDNARRMEKAYYVKPFQLVE